MKWQDVLIVIVGNKMGYVKDAVDKIQEKLDLVDKFRVRSCNNSIKLMLGSRVDNNALQQSAD